MSFGDDGDSDDGGGDFNLESELLAELTGKPTASGGGDDSEAPEEKPLSLRSTMARGEVTVDDDEQETSGFPSPAGDEEDEEEEVAEEPEVAETPPTEQEVLDIFAEARAQGLDLSSKYKTPKDALNGLLNATRLVGQRNQLAILGERLATDPLGVYQEMKAKLEPHINVERAPEVKKPQPGDAPEYNPDWADAFDDTGKLLPGADPTIPGKVEKYSRFIQERARKFAHDPVGELMPLLEKQIDARAQAKAAELLDQYSYRQQVERQQAEVFDSAHRLINEESSWIFVDGDKAKGPSEQGKVFHKWLQITETPDHTGELPIKDMYMRKEFAKAMAKQELGLLAEANAAPSRKTQQQKIAKKPSKASREPTDKNWPADLTLEEALARALDK